MKKIELHLHLEGAAPPDFIRGLAKEKRADLSGVFDDRGHYAYDDFPGFLRCYEAATSVINGPRDYARLLDRVSQPLMRALAAATAIGKPSAALVRLPQDATATNSRRSTMSKRIHARHGGLRRQEDPQALTPAAGSPPWPRRAVARRRS